MASFLDTEGYLQEEVKLDKWRLPSVVVRELYGDELETLKQWARDNSDASEHAFYRRVVQVASLNPKIASPDDLIKVSPSAVEYIAKKIQALGKTGAKMAEEAEKN